jgi:hypothetical protein
MDLARLSFWVASSMGVETDSIQLAAEILTLSNGEAGISNAS